MYTPSMCNATAGSPISVLLSEPTPRMNTSVLPSCTPICRPGTSEAISRALVIPTDASLLSVKAAATPEYFCTSFLRRSTVTTTSSSPLPAPAGPGAPTSSESSTSSEASGATSAGAPAAGATALGSAGAASAGAAAGSGGAAAGSAAGACAKASDETSEDPRNPRSGPSAGPKAKWNRALLSIATIWVSCLVSGFVSGGCSGSQVVEIAISDGARCGSASTRKVEGRCARLEQSSEGSGADGSQGSRTVCIRQAFLPRLSKRGSSSSSAARCSPTTWKRYRELCLDGCLDFQKLCETLRVGERMKILYIG